MGESNLGNRPRALSNSSKTTSPMPKPSAGRSTLPPLMSLTQIVVTPAAGDGAKLALAVKGLEHHAGVIGQAANDLIINLHKIAQAARGEILQNAFQFRRRLAGFDELIDLGERRAERGQFLFAFLRRRRAPICQ